MFQQQGYVVGADIGGTSLRLALAGMDGKILGKWTVSTAGIRDPHKVVSLIQEGVDDLLQQNSVPRSLLRAVAAGAPGVTNVDEGVVIATSYLMGWRDVPFRALLEAKLGVPVAVDNDVNVAAIAESKIGAARGVKDFVFVALGTGIGAGIVLNGQIFHGMNWSAGEIGYLLVPGTPVTPVETGELTALGHRKSKQIGVGNLTRGQDLGWIDEIRCDETKVVLPEHMACQGCQPRNDRCNRRR